MKKYCKSCLICFLLALTIYSCSKNEDFIPHYKVFNVATTPYINKDSAEIGVPIILLDVGKTASFLDASTNIKQREWFVEGGDVLGMDNDEVIESEDKISILYEEPGEYSVRLVSSFDDQEITYIRVENDTITEGGSSTTICYQCKIVDYHPETTLDTTFIVKVFDSVQPNFSIVGENFEVGESVKFMDESKGEPREWEWTFEGANNPNSNEQNPEPSWNRAGTYDVTLRAIRPAFEGETARSTGKKTFIDAITILPSSEPLVLENINLNETGDRLRLEFNREINIPDFAEFNLSVEGDPIEISRIVQPFENNYTILDIYLQGSLENLSRLTIESTQNIFTFDDNSPLENGFTETILFFNQELNLFPIGYGSMEPSKIIPQAGDAEILDSKTGGSDAYWNTEPGNITELSQDAFLGENSLVWVARKIDSRGSTPYIPLEQGKDYKIIFYAKTNVENAAIDVLVLTENNDKNPSQLLSAPVSMDWTKFQFTITAEESIGHYIRILNSQGDDNVKFWVDEISVFED